MEKFCQYIFLDHTHAYRSTGEYFVITLFQASPDIFEQFVAYLQQYCGDYPTKPLLFDCPHQ